MLALAFIIASFFPPYNVPVPANQLAPGVVAGQCFAASSDPIPVVVPVTCSGGGGSGTVTSVGLALPSIFNVTGSPVTLAGTLTGSLATELANSIFAGPSSGGAAIPSFRALTASDIPSIPFSGITGIVPVAQGGTGTASPAFTAGTGISITGSFPALTITNTSPSSGGTVTSVTATGPNLTSSGGTTPNITLIGAPTLTGTNFTGIPFTGVTGIVPVAQGGTGTATPALIAGTGITLSGSFPAQTITNSAPASGAAVPTPSATGQLLYSANGSTYVLLNIGTTSMCLSVAASEPSWVACPTLSGTNTFGGTNSFTTSPTVGGISLVTQTGPTAWTPTDASGAGLTLTVATANYVKTGRSATFSAQVTYPTTANTNPAELNLPTSGLSATNQACAGVGVGLAFALDANISSSNIFFVTSSFANVTNAQLSGTTVVFGCSYITGS